MTNTIIIEDETPAADNLIRLLKHNTEPFNILEVLDSVEDSVTWLKTNPVPDLIFMDIQLKDGNSFSIFEQVKVLSPIVFITAYDSFLLKAFEQNSIEFLLKPIDAAAIEHTICKYKNLQHHFLYKYEELLSRFAGKTKRTRMIAKKGIEYQSILLEDIACFYTEHKITFIITRQEKKFMLDQNLREIEEEIDDRLFFRANRKYIVNVNCIKSYRTYEKVKIVLELTVAISEQIIISQENTASFKKWISGI